MKPLYITFDPYYTVENYNSFLNSAKNNDIEFEEYIKIRPPFYRFIKLKSKADLPSFVDYDVATSSDAKFLVSAIKATQPNEEYNLRRREGKDIRYFDYILPKVLKNAHKKKYIMVFKAMSFSELSILSKELKDIKIYKWGKSELKKYNIYYCFNPYIKNFLSTKDILMEFGEEASYGMKHDKQVPSTPGDLEYYLNYYVLIKEKLENKTYESEFWENGNRHPLKKESFI